MNDETKIPAMPNLGVNLRKERKKKDLSLTELASVSGISKAMLSQIETNKVNPTIVTLWKISHALSVELNTLISGEEEHKKIFEVVRGNELPSISPDSDGVKFTVLSPTALAEDLDFYRVNLPPGSRHRASAHEKGTQELLFVSLGSVIVETPDASAELNAGDTLRYDADVPHALYNSGKSPSELFMVVRFQKK